MLRFNSPSPALNEAGWLERLVIARPMTLFLHTSDVVSSSGKPSPCTPSKLRVVEQLVMMQSLARVAVAVHSWPAGGMDLDLRRRPPRCT